MENDKTTCSFTQFNIANVINTRTSLESTGILAIGKCTLILMDKLIIIKSFYTVVKNQIKLPEEHLQHESLAFPAFRLFMVRVWANILTKSKLALKGSVSIGNPKSCKSSRSIVNERL